MNIDVNLHLTDEAFGVFISKDTMTLAKYSFGHGITIFATPEQMLKIADEIYKQHGGIKNERVSA